MTASWHRTVRLTDLAANSARSVTCHGRAVCLSLADGRPVAVADVCAHRNIALSGGLVRDGVLTCPGHFWRYDLRTGQCLHNLERVESFPCRLVDGWIEVDVPAPPAPMSMRAMLLARARGVRPR